MSEASHVVAIDAGTTGIRVSAYDRSGRRTHSDYREFTQHYPRPGWVEHDADEIWEVTQTLLRSVIGQLGDPRRVAGIGITNQRETTVLWRRESGEPLARAIVWQDRRTRDLCEAHRARGEEKEIRARTGLLLDAYFSATKIEWLMREVDAVGRLIAERPEAVCFGTIESFLAFKLSGSKAHVTDHTNASRTLLYDIDAHAFSDDLCSIFGVPRAILPRVIGSAERYGETPAEFFGASIPLAGLVGDQQGALFGQGCVRPGQSKNTYGTGCFALLHCGAERPPAPRGLITTIACDAEGRPAYALEGSVFVGGAVIQWLRDGLGVIGSAAESEAIARSVPDTGGVHFVPAFTGLGAPYWDMDARGAILGLTRGSTRAHIVRAAIEAICHQSADLLEALEEAAGERIPELRVDGGAVANGLLCELQADLMGVPIVRPADTETTARGAAYLAGLGTGFWSGFAEVEPLVSEGETRFEPSIGVEERSARRAGWKAAVERVRTAG